MDDVDDDLTQLAIRKAFQQYGQYHEAIWPDDIGRVDRLGRAGREVADELGVEVSPATLPQRDGSVWVCLLVVKPDAIPEPI